MRPGLPGVRKIDERRGERLELVVSIGTEELVLERARREQAFGGRGRLLGKNPLGGDPGESAPVGARQNPGHARRVVARSGARVLRHGLEEEPGLRAR